MRKLPKVKKAWAEIYRRAMGKLRHSSMTVEERKGKCGGMCAAVGIASNLRKWYWEIEDSLALFYGKKPAGFSFWYPEGLWPLEYPSRHKFRLTNKQMLAKEHGYTSRIIALELMALYCEEHGE